MFVNVAIVGVYKLSLPKTLLTFDPYLSIQHLSHENKKVITKCRYIVDFLFLRSFK